MLANALKQLEEALHKVEPICPPISRKSVYRSRSTPATHILTQSGLIYSTNQLNQIAEEEKQMSEHTLLTASNGFHMDDNSNQCHPRQFRSFSPSLNKTNNGITTTSAITTSLVHPEMENDWQQVEENQQDVLNGNYGDGQTMGLEETKDENLTALNNGLTTHSPTESSTNKSIQSDSLVQLPCPTIIPQQMMDMECSEKAVWDWSASQRASRADVVGNGEDCVESGAESSAFGAESPPSVHQSSSSSAKAADVDWNKLIKAIDEEKLSVPDPRAKMKILKWLSFSSEAPPTGALFAVELAAIAVQMRRKSDPSYLRRHSQMYGGQGSVGARGTPGTPGGNVELAKGVARSVTSVDSMAAMLMGCTNLGVRNKSQASSASSIGGVFRKDSQGSGLRSGSAITSNSYCSRPALPYIAHYSDSGFSSFSSCSYLPPPPPYRSPKCSNDVSSPETNSHQQAATSISNQLSSMVIQMEQEDAFSPSNPIPTLNLQKESAFNRRIYRSLSDSKSYSGQLHLQPEEESTSKQKAQKAFLSLRRGSSRGKKRHEVRSASGSIALGEPVQQQIAPCTTTSSTIQSQLGSELHHTRLGGSCSEAYSGARTVLANAVNRYSAASSSYTTTTNNSMMSLSPSPSMVSTVSCPEYPELQEKLHKLAMARDTLSIQVTVLNDQVGVQKSKIRDLEELLESKRSAHPYELLSEQSILAHESNRSHLMNEICDLKNKFSFLQKEKSDAERRLTLSHNEIERLSQSMHHMQMAAAATYSCTNFPMPINAAPPAPRTINNDNGSNTEMEKLRETVQKLIADNAQKNMEISSLRNALDEQSRSGREFDSFTSAGYESNSQRSSIGVGPTVTNGPPPLLTTKKPLNMDINQQLRNLLIEDMKENIAHSSSYPTSLCNSVSSHQLPSHQAPPELSNPHLVGTGRGYYGIGMQPSNSYTSALSSATSLPPIWNNGAARGYPSNLYNTHQPVFVSGAPTLMSALPPAFNMANVSSYRSPSSPAARQLAAELDELRRAEGNFLAPHQQQQPLYGTSSLPRSLHSKSNSTVSMPRQKHGGGAATTSGVESDDELARGRQSSASATTTNGKFKRGRTRSTLRNFLGKLARSSSQEIRNVPNGQRSNGIKTSISTRLNSIGTPALGPICIRPPVQHFVDWGSEQVCEWMAEAGFNQYVPEVEKFVRSGRHMLNMSNQEFEKELLIKNQLHRKRLRCLLNCIERNTGNVVEQADRMDIHQIMLWLDDIGLPQYRDVFAENLIDGQMLLCLTAQDLVEMKIVSAMNHATIARALQFLRSIDFCSYRLEKKFNPDLMKRCPIPNEVERWAHSCVVQWLKSIDLSEFTPNLMFSGLHGALMIHEPTFSAESLAELLQIPPHKTLLRRHLTSHFNTCLGQEIISRKRDILAQPFVTYLSPALKIRLLRKGFSLSRKKSKQDVFVDPDVPVCPSSANLVQDQVSEMTDI